MKIHWAVRSLSLLIMLLLLCLIMRQDDIIRNGQDGYSFTSFNRAGTQEAQKIMGYWKAEPDKSRAVITLIDLDYGLMVVYSLYLFFSLYFTAGRERRTWLKRWLQTGIRLLILFTAIDAFQDYTISQFVNTGETARSMRIFTITKWSILFAGVLLPLVIALLPP